MTSRLPEWDDYDVKEVFKYAEGFTTDDVAETIYQRAGDNEGPDWVAVGRLKDGKFFYCAAGCDYTGWG